ncbi:hypothetical protein WLV03_25170, partial [Bordetella bronchiseptica]
GHGQAAQQRHRHGGQAARQPAAQQQHGAQRAQPAGQREIDGQGVPKYGAGLYLYDMPWGSDGLLGMAGVLGLCVALVAALAWALERFPARTAAPAR